MSSKESEDIDQCIATLESLKVIRQAYASGPKGCQLVEEMATALALSDSLLRKNIATAISAWLSNKSLQQINRAA